MGIIDIYPPLRDFLEVAPAVAARGRLWSGSGRDIADRLERWFTERAFDGFVVAGTHMPGSFEDFVRFVVPELQRRGLYRKEVSPARPCGKTSAFQ